MDPVRSTFALARSLASRDPTVRYDGRHYLATEIAHRLGHFRTYNSNLYWPDDAAFVEAWSGFPESDGAIKDRKFVLWSMARSVAHMGGRTAECGVYNGGSSWLICTAFAEAATDGWRHHMFDSFEGLSEPEEIDRPTEVHTYRWAKHDLSVGLDRVRRNMRRFEDRVELHPGWIPDAFPDLPGDERFAFVHIDVDLHQPTLDSLRYFYDRMLPHGVILCDDYGFTSCPGARQAFDEFVAERPERTVVHLTTGQGYIVKR